MWALLMQLGELIPHLSRLVPMLERMLSKGRPDGADAASAQMDQLREASDSLGAAQGAVVRQLGAQGVQLASIEADVRLAREAAARTDEKLDAMGQQVAALRMWLGAASLAALLMLAAILFLLLHAAAR